MYKLLTRAVTPLLAWALLAAPAPAKPAPVTELATLGGGCFWCIEAIYQDLRGVQKLESGFSGGSLPDPTYDQVTGGDTGHAEVVHITFDPRTVSYKELLEVFFTVHDPTTRDRQGADVGSQYRSVVFYHSAAQKAAAEAVVADFTRQKVWKDKIVTEIAPFSAFYKAESYHQGYYSKNRLQPYCMVVIAPKVAKFRKKFLSKLKTARS